MPLFRDGVFYTSIPLGLAYIGAGLEAAGFDIEVFDCNTSDMGVAELSEKILSFGPDFLGVSVSSPGSRYARELIEAVKRGRGVTSGNISIFVGGAHVDAGASFSDVLDADLYFRGEGDLKCPKVLQGLLRSGTGGSPDSFWGGDTATTPDPFFGGDAATSPDSFDCGIIEDLDGLPLPARHAFDQSKYRFVALSASRGCPFGCVYCGMACTRYRRRSVGSVEGEIDSLRGDQLGSESTGNPPGSESKGNPPGSESKGNPPGPNPTGENHITPLSVDFIDDVFTMDRDHAWEMAEMLKDKKIEWAATTRADLVDSELLEHMKDCGLTHLSFGIESGDEGIREALGKDLSDRSIVSAFSECRRMGIMTRAYGIIGSFGEDAESIRKTFDFIEGLAPTEVMYSPLILFPGTAAWEAALAEGSVSPDAWEDYARGRGPVPVYVPEGLSLEYIDRVIDERSRDFYLHPKRIFGRARFAQGPSDLVDCSKAFLAYFFRSFIKDDER